MPAIAWGATTSLRTELIGPSVIAGVYADLAVHPEPELPAGPLPAADRYVLHEEIARGGMGVVQRATDTLLDREVVVKLLREDLIGRQAAERRFLREARINGQLQHPGIVPVYDVGRLAGGRPFLTMRYLPGRTLEAELQSLPGQGARPELVPAVLEVCAIMAYAHSRGVVHRDLKPANVLLCPDGSVRVLDWGLAKVLTRLEDSCQSVRSRVASPTDSFRMMDTTPEIDSAELTGRMTRPGSSVVGQAVGTPAYMPPEQARAETQVDERADVFGLGGLLSVVLTGRPPYTASDPAEVWHQALEADLLIAHRRLAGCGARLALIDLAMRCLQADPQDRPRDAREVAGALAAILQTPEQFGESWWQRLVHGLPFRLQSRL